MRAFVIVLKLLAPVPVLIGLLHVSMGPGADVVLGAKIPPEVMRDAVLDSQNRFYGAMFMAFGPLLWICATDLRRHATIFRILGAFIFLGGIARVFSIAATGVPSAPVIGLIVIELVLVPALLLWHMALLGGEDAGSIP